MSAFSSPSLPTVPVKFRRKSSSASTRASMNSHMYSLDDAVPSSSPPSSSSPLLTPLHPTRPYKCMEWQAGGDLTDLDGFICDPRDSIKDIVCPSSHALPEFLLPHTHQPLPSLLTKFTVHALGNNAPLSYSPSLFPRTTYFYSQGDSAIADDFEEYDLESMDIHLRETYFATSAERGRWLSSPLAPRVRPQPIPPVHAHSSPIRAPASPSPLKEPSHRYRNSSVDRSIPTLSEDRKEGLCSSFSLPPSSPLASPISNLSFLDGDYKDDSVGDPRSNSEDRHFFIATPELSASSTTCTSLVEPTRTPIPHEVSAIVPALHPTGIPCDSLDSVISHQTSPRPNRPPKLIDVHNTACFEPDSILSPLSQFELDLPEVEPTKLPLSDTVNRPYPGQHKPSPGVTLLSQSGPSSTQSLSIQLNCGPNTVGGWRVSTRAEKRGESDTGSSGIGRMKEHVRPGSPSSDAKKRAVAEGYTSNHPGPSGKKSKPSRGDSESRGVKSLARRGRTRKIKQHSRSSTRCVIEGNDSEPAYPRDKNMAKLTDHVQLEQSTSGSRTTLDPVDAANVEFHMRLTGMLVEAFATSRATSMDAAALYLVLAQAHPNLAAEQSKEELLANIVARLEAGRARCGMFEKVESSGERSRHKALESRWFYVAEQDEDAERASLISTIMPRQKRNETKKYKQYYYRPLAKMSRWDPEDAP